MDINPMFQPLVAVLRYLILFLNIAGIAKTPWFKGKFGEYRARQLDLLSKPGHLFCGAVLWPGRLRCVTVSVFRQTCPGR